MKDSPTINSHYGLAIHTSSSELGLAIGSSDRDLRVRVWDLGRDMSAFLHQYLLEFLTPQTWSDVAFISVAIGPGSFTGTRIGVVTARTLAQQLDLPLYGISSLAAAVLSHTQQDESSRIAIQMPAQRGELFAAIYERSPRHLSTLVPDMPVLPEIWQEKRSQFSDLDEIVEIAAGEGLGRSVTGVWELANREWQQGKRPDWSEIIPFYGHHPVNTVPKIA